jgi:hypothetical protein
VRTSENVCRPTVSALSQIRHEHMDGRDVAVIARPGAGWQATAWARTQASAGAGRQSPTWSSLPPGPVDRPPPGPVDSPPPGPVERPPPGPVDRPPPGPVDMPPRGPVDSPPSGPVEKPPPGPVDLSRPTLVRHDVHCRWTTDISNQIHSPLVASTYAGPMLLATDKVAVCRRDRLANAGFTPPAAA